MEGRRGKGRGDASGVEDHAPQKRGLRGLRVRTTAGLPRAGTMCSRVCGGRRNSQCNVYVRAASSFE